MENYKKNRSELIEETLEEYGFLFCFECRRSSGFRNLHTHHLMWKSEFQNHPNLHHKDNLLICCNECHLDDKDSFHNDKSKRDPYIKERNLKELFK